MRRRLLKSDVPKVLFQCYKFCEWGFLCIICSCWCPKEFRVFGILFLSPSKLDWRIICVTMKLNFILLAIFTFPFLVSESKYLILSSVDLPLTNSRRYTHMLVSTSMTSKLGILTKTPSFIDTVIHHNRGHIKYHAEISES